MTNNNRQKDRGSNTDIGIEEVLFNVQCLFAVRFAVHMLCEITASHLFQTTSKLVKSNQVAYYL